MRTHVTSFMSDYFTYS